MTYFRSFVFATAAVAATLPALAQSAPEAAQPSAAGTVTPASTASRAEAVPDTGMKKTVSAPRTHRRVHHLHAHNAVPAATPAPSK